MKHIKLIVSLFTFVLILTIPKVYAEELDWCEMSDEYREWLNAEDKSTLIEPNYCKDETESYSPIVLTVENLFDITSASVSDVYYSSLDSGYVTSAKNQNNNNGIRLNFTQRQYQREIKNQIKARYLELNARIIIQKKFSP